MNQPLSINDIVRLPTGVKWEILSHFPFIDLINFCLAIFDTSIQGSHDVCSPDYFRQRLVSYGINPSRYKLLLTIFGANNSRDAYVKALIDAKAVNLDPTVLIYLDNSEILFPGLEYFIGLRKMGLRAINQNSSDYLSYVLQMFPAMFERWEIIGATYMKYRENPTQFTLMDPNRLVNMIHESTAYNFTIFGRYYPVDQQYQAYMTGLSGHHQGSLYSSTQEEAYVSGLIDGGHERLFVAIYEDYRRRNYCNIPDVNTYVAQRGTVSMIKTVMESQPSPFSTLKFIFLEEAVKFDNIPVVNYILSTYPFEDEPNLLPRSGEMVDLLKRMIWTDSDRDEIYRQRTFLGAFRAGNYDFLLTELGSSFVVKVSEDELMEEELTITMARGPAFIMSKYIMKFGTLDNEDFIETLMKEHLIDSSDLYRVEVILSLGYQPSDDVKDEIRQMLDSAEDDKFASLEIHDFRNLQRYELSQEN